MTLSQKQLAWYSDKLATARETVKPWQRWSDQFHLKGLRNFTAYEFACRGTGLLAIDFEAAKRLQKMRDLLNVPLHITSGYRSPDYNALVGGSAHSMHMLGLAFDISVIGLDPHRVEDAAREVGFMGIGRYPLKKFIHVDARNWTATWGPDW